MFPQIPVHISLYYSIYLPFIKPLFRPISAKCQYHPVFLYLLHLHKPCLMFHVPISSPSFSASVSPSFLHKPDTVLRHPCLLLILLYLQANHIFIFLIIISRSISVLIRISFIITIFIIIFIKQYHIFSTYLGNFRFEPLKASLSYHTMPSEYSHWCLNIYKHLCFLISRLNFIIFLQSYSSLYLLFFIFAISSTIPHPIAVSCIFAFCFNNDAAICLIHLSNNYPVPYQCRNFPHDPSRLHKISFPQSFPSVPS